MLYPENSVACQLHLNKKVFGKKGCTADTCYDTDETQTFCCRKAVREKRRICNAGQ